MVFGAHEVLVRCLLQENEVYGGHLSHGGAIFAGASATLQILQCTLSGNMVRYSGASSLGGAIYGYLNSTMNLTGTVLSSNSARDGGIWSLGGAIYGGTDSTILLTQCTLTANSVNGGRWCCGGAVHSSFRSTIQLVHCTLSNNIAQGNSSVQVQGGALWAMQNSLMNLTRVQLLHNMVIAGPGDALLAEGGALYIGTNGSLIAHKCELIGNSAGGGTSSNGGAISALTNTHVTIEDSLLQGNTAANATRDSRGGALFVWLGESTVTLTNTTFESNIAKASEVSLSAMAGAVFIDEGNLILTISGCHFLHNSALGSAAAAAGALVLSKGNEVQIHDSSLIGNTAAGSNAQAGAIVSAARHLRLVKAIIEGNLARAEHGTALGGGLCVQQGRSTLEECLIR